MTTDSTRKAGALIPFLLLLFFHPLSSAVDEPGRNDLDAMAVAAVSQLLAQQPELANALGESPGYAVISMTSAKIPAVGTGLGYGVVVDNRSDTRHYLKVTQFEVGSGVGAQKFKVIILFSDVELLERMVKGGWRYEGGADFTAGTDDATSLPKVASGPGTGYRIFKLAEGGLQATVTIRVLQAKPYLQ